MRGDGLVVLQPELQEELHFVYLCLCGGFSYYTVGIGNWPGVAAVRWGWAVRVPYLSLFDQHDRFC